MSVEDLQEVMNQQISAGIILVRGDWAPFAESARRAECGRQGSSSGRPHNILD